MSIKKNGIIDRYEIAELAEYIILKFQGHQLVAAVHIDNENTYHAHIIMSHINVFTGKKFSVPYYFFNALSDDINDYIEREFA